MTFDPSPKITGRFNFGKTSEDRVNVYFTPFDGNIAAIVAKNIPFGEGVDLMKALNDELQETKENIGDV